ncbi:Protein-lysine N-methyltransferase EFM6 [Aspergillus mulundensis]|uniref:Protein-lysine N-methyltransferase EFM6 n=1 Tax=Aspergillus mulundensis TaxID=1810919 RepID=A0A3D8QC17_9EURO|nr:Protein-lysine N-methyltransferase EFM6 [Aspergillus mulundensis]RDW59396.1 Protein-lysine N-methyltransferase EFM6 [Aspergillus mulundensis]
MEDIRPGSANSNDAFDISESLVPAREIKQAGQSHVSFDGLLQQPLLLKEDLKEGCGGQLWPAGMVLSKYMLRQHRSDLVDKTILELGAGGGLVGLAVASGCAVGPSPIYITDQLPMFPLMEANIALNDLANKVKAAVLDWGTSISDDIPRHPDIILAADCVYFEPAFPLLISTLRDLLGPNSDCYFCFKKRRRADLRFLKLAKKAFQVTEINDDPDAETYKRENINLFSIRAKHDG